MSGEELAPQMASVESPQMISTIKIHMLKKGEYTLWSMRMEQYLTNTDYSLWQVIMNGDEPVQTTKDENGVEPEYQLRFHTIKDAKSLWAAIKSRFGGNVESKKMQKNVLKQQFKNFSVSDTEGLDKAYDRFQKLISQLEIHDAVVSNEDVNQKFLRALPLSWNNIALIMRNKEGIDELDINDLYNNLKVFEADIKGSSGSSSNSQNVAFLSAEDINSINESSGPQLDDEDLEQLDQDNLEEIDIKWQVVMLSMRVKCFYKKTGRKLIFNGKEPVGYRSMDNTRRTVPVENSDALVVQDNALIDLTQRYNLVLKTKKLQKQFDEQRQTLSKANLEIVAYQLGLESVEAQLVVHQKNEVVYEEKITVLEFEVKDKGSTKDIYKYHAVPPPLIGNYIPPLADLSFAGLDDFVYRPSGVSLRLVDEEKALHLMEYDKQAMGTKSQEQDTSRADQGMMRMLDDAEYADPYIMKSQCCQNAENVHDIRLLPAKLMINMTTELSGSNHWLSENEDIRSSTTKVESEPLNGSNADIPNKCESEQALNVSAENRASRNFDMMSDHNSSDLAPQRQMASAENNTSGRSQLPQSDTNVFTMKIEILLEPASNKLLVGEIVSLQFIQSIMEARSRVQDLTSGEIVSLKFIESNNGSSRHSDDVDALRHYDREQALLTDIKILLEGFIAFEWKLLDGGKIAEAQMIRARIYTVNDDACRKTVQEPASEYDQALKNVLDKMMDQEKEATEQSDAVRKEFEAQGDKPGEELRKMKGIVGRKTKTTVAQGYKQMETALIMSADDIIFSSTKKSLCDEFEQIMHNRFQMSSIGELTFFLGLQVKRPPPTSPPKRERGWVFISQDKVCWCIEILRNLGFSSLRTSSILWNNTAFLTRMKIGEDVDVNLYRSMIGSLMYLTILRPEYYSSPVCCLIIFQFQPKVSHLNAVKRIFRYLKGQPKLGLWYPKDSPITLEAFSDSDYAGANLDRKSTTRGCQFLGSRIPVYISKQKHFRDQHRFIRDSYEKRLIEMVKIHTDNNVADLLTKAFDVSRFNFLVASIGKRGRDTKIPQSGGPPIKVGDETVHKELGDRIKRATTTASSFEAKQDSESDDEEDLEDPSKQGRKITKIDKDLSISLVQDEGTSWIQEDIEILKKIKHSTVIPEVSTTTANLVYIRRSAQKRKDKGKAIMQESKPPKKVKKRVQVQMSMDEELAKKVFEEEQAKAMAEQEQERINFEAALELQKYDPAVLRYHAQLNRPYSVAEVRKNMVMYLKNQGGYKMNYFKGIKYEDIRPIFEKVWDQIQSFAPMDYEKEKGSEKKGSRKKSLARKRAGKKQSEESTKRQKIEDDLEKEELKAYLDLVSREEFSMKIESLATKYLIVDWKTYDVIDLHRLVKARYMTSSPEGYDIMLWGDLMTLFELDEEDEV
ncbi:hypothetical protein Tco_1156571 [Tanacetum coccineum]